MQCGSGLRWGNAESGVGLWKGADSGLRVPEGPWVGVGDNNKDFLDNHLLNVPQDWR